MRIPRLGVAISLKVFVFYCHCEPVRRLVWQSVFHKNVFNENTQ